MILSGARLGDRSLDIRIESGLIAEIAEHGDLRGGASVGDVDLDGRWVTPGLWDHHVHYTQWVLNSQRLDLLGATSASHAAEIVGAAIAAGASGLVIGGGLRDSLWSDAPTLAVLDRVSRDQPVVLASADLHSAWLNSAALAMYGHTGHATGRLSEDDAFAVFKQLRAFSPETIDGWAKDASLVASSRGVVGIVDLEMDWNLETWTRRMANGFDSLRVEFNVYTEHLERAIAEGLTTGQACGELLTMGRFKVITDGSLNTRTAYTYDEYPEGGHGQLNLPIDELVVLMRKAAAAGILPDIHAIGDRANTLVLDAFEAVATAGRLEHGQLLSESDYSRFAKLGVEVSVQPEQAMDDRDVADRLWAGRTHRTYPFRSLFEAGATVLFGSDAPVAPLDPWLAIAAAVSRSRDGREPWHPEQCITNEQALGASVRSTIAVGQPADIVVTGLDPLAATGEQLRTMPVAMTLLAGRITYDGR